MACSTSKTLLFIKRPPGRFFNGYYVVAILFRPIYWEISDES